MGSFVFIGVAIVAFIVFVHLGDLKRNRQDVEGMFWLAMTAFFIASVACFVAVPAEVPASIFTAGVFSAFIILWWRYQKPPPEPAVPQPDPMWKVYQDLVSNPPPIDTDVLLNRAYDAIDRLKHPTGTAMKELLAQAIRYEKLPQWEHVPNLTPDQAVAALQQFYNSRSAVYEKTINACVERYAGYVKELPASEGEFKSAPGYAPPEYKHTTLTFVHSLPLKYIDNCVYFDEPKNLTIEKIHARLEGVAERFYLPWSASIPEHLRFEHTWVLGPQGSGKTQTIQHLITRDLNKRASIFVMDSQGDLVRNVSTIASIQDRLLLVEPETVSVNPFDLRGDAAIELLSYVFGAMGDGAEFTPRQKMLYQFGIRLMQEVPNATLLTFADLLTNGLDPYEQYVQRLSTTAQMFFSDDFRAKGLQETKDGVGWRLKLMLSDPTFERMFTRPTNLDLKSALDGEKVVVVDTSQQKLGAERSALFGRFMIAYLLYASQQRASQVQSDRLPVFAYIDEAHEYLADDSVARILDQARKMKIAMLLANQRTAQVKNPNMLDALMATSIKLIRADTDSNLSQLARVMRTKPETLSGVTKYPQTFCLHLRGQEDVFPAVIPFGTMEALPHISEPRRVIQAHPPLAVRPAVREEPIETVDPTKASTEL